jgi:hypothetical protein
VTFGLLTSVVCARQLSIDLRISKGDTAISPKLPKKKPNVRNRLVLGLLLVAFSGNFETSYPQTRKTTKPGVKLQYEGRTLYTRVNGKKYFIDEAAPGPSGALAILDSSQQNVYYVQNTGCGFENEGTTLLVSDVYGRISVPILSRCEILTPVRFFNSQGRTYLLISEENGATMFGTSFWFFDVAAKRFEVHAEGQILAKGSGPFSYGVYDESENLISLGTVTLQTLINRGRPLRLLPRQPTRALTLNNDTKLVFTDPYCTPQSNGESRTIDDAGSQVLIAEECPDGDYVVYYHGSRGKVAKRDLKLLLSNQISRGPNEPAVPLADLDFRKRDRAVQAKYQKLNSQWTRKQISKQIYVASLKELREEELTLYSAARKHYFKDPAEYNYWYQSRLKFPSQIEMELKSITANDR